MRLLLFSLSLLILFTQSTPSQAVTWSNAPLACVPDRATKWIGTGEKEPCHCPPQTFCPRISVTPRDLTYIVSGDFARNLDSAPIVPFYMTIRGTEAPNVSPSDAFALSNNELLLALKGPILAKSPEPLRKFAELFIDYHGSWNTPPGVERGGGWDTWGGAFMSMTATVQLNNSVTIAEALANSKMPPGLMKNCCDTGFCPPNTIATTKNVEVAYSVKDPKTGVISQEIKNVPSLVCENNRQTSWLREGCVLEGSEVTLADGSVKKVEELRIGDEVKTRKGQTRIKAINRFTQFKEEVYSINGGRPLMTIEHPLLTTTGWKAIDPSITTVKSGMGVVGKLVVGDTLVTADGTVKVTSITKHPISAETNAYNLSIEDEDSGFVANGYIVKGFHKVQIQY